MKEFLYLYRQIVTLLTLSSGYVLDISEADSLAMNNLSSLLIDKPTHGESVA